MTDTVDKALQDLAATARAAHTSATRTARTSTTRAART